MKKSMTIKKGASPKKKSEVEKAVKNPIPVNTGDLVIHSRDGGIYKVGKIKAKKGEIELFYEDSEGEYCHYGTWNYEDPNEKLKYIRLDKPVEDLEKDLAKEFESGFKSFTSPQDTPSDSTDLMLISGHSHVISLKNSLEVQQSKLAVMTALMERKRNEIRHIMDGLKKQIQSVRRVVDIIELYMGVNEEIIQIREGEPAPVTEPITFRQLVLFMDEEVGDERDGGLDWQDVDVFDNWMQENYARLLPEKKGVVVVRPRRSDKDYRILDNDPVMSAFINAGMNEKNRDTYILIRNGENLYRIWTDLKIYPHLFPSQEEMIKLSDEEDVKFSSDRERNKDSILAYKRNVLIMQGLIDRTDIFKPIPVGLHLMKPETYGDHVRFIYDGSNLLSNGRKSWDEYLKDINSRVTKGSRIFFSGFPYWLFAKDDRGYSMWRFPLHNKGWRENRHPPMPPKGIYNVKEVRACPDRYLSETAFLLNWKRDGEERWDNARGFVERKAATPFLLSESDNFYLNYDELSLDDIEYYLNDRVNRKDYLRMMPVLRGIKKLRLEELEAEKNFVRFISGKLGKSGPEFEKSVWDAIAWWKMKVIEKRPLTKEDAKAVRMILRKLKGIDSK